MVCHFFPNVCTSVMKTNLSNYSEIIFYYNTRIHSKYKAFLTKVSKVFLASRGRIIKTLVKLQCSAPCIYIYSYNMKATMCQQCCKSGSYKIYKFIVGRLYMCYYEGHIVASTWLYLQHGRANQRTCYKL